MGRSVAESWLMEVLDGGYLTLPFFIFDNYRLLGMSDLEMMVVLHLLRLRQGNQAAGLPVNKLAKVMSADTETIKGLLAGLIEKRLLVVYQEGATTVYQLEGIFDNLLRLKEEGSGPHLAGLPEVAAASEAATPEQLIRAFEGEFGRPLSPLEANRLDEWLRQDGFSTELIAEALKRSVLRGVLNFSFMDSILRNWQKNGVRSPSEARLYEERFQDDRQRRHLPRGNKNNPGQASTGAASKGKGRYDDVYAN